MNDYYVMFSKQKGYLVIAFSLVEIPTLLASDLLE